MNNTDFVKIALKTVAIGVMVSLTACQTINLPSFKKELIPVPIYTPQLIEGASKTLLISPMRVPCNTEKPMQCMVTKLDNGNLDAVFMIPYNWIVGFTPKVNTEYKISAHPLMDENNNNKITGQWQLDTILSQKPVR